MRNGAISRLVGSCLALVSVLSCQPKGESAPNSSQASAAMPASRPRPAATAAQWNDAIAKVFDKVNVERLRDKKNPAYIEDKGKTDENGITTFFACFDKAPPKCDLAFSGERDGFRNVQFFTDPIMELNELKAKYVARPSKSSVRAYVSLRDCNRPVVFLQPTFRAPTWIFLEQIAVMADGTVVLDRKLEYTEVDRDNDTKGVSELTHLMLTDEETAALRKIAEAQEVLIRLGRQREYIAVDNDGTKVFVRSIERLLSAHDALAQAVKQLGPVKDAACPA